MPTLEELSVRFDEFSTDSAARSPLYATLAGRIADSSDVARLLLAAPETQQLPVLLFAAVHDLVLRRPDLPLAEFYPTTSDEPRTDDAWPTFLATCRDHSTELGDLIAVRSVQTNEIGRCALFLPPLGLLAAEQGDLALVDIGTSAGLNLRLDAYEYHYSPGGRIGGPSAAVLECGTRGEPPIPTEVPRITRRIGVDRSPIDVTEEDQARWLMACLWPDQRERVARLRAALAIARETPIDLRAGDAVDALASAVADAAAAGHPVVMNSWVLNYLTGTERSAYVAELDRFGAERDVTWVFAESASLCPELPMPTYAVHESLTLVMVVRWRAGARTVTHAATAHPHGQWMHWGDQRNDLRDRRDI